MLCVCVKRWILTHVLLSIFLSSLLLILALAWQIQYCLSCCADESFWKALTVNRHISASNLWNMFDKTFSMCSPPLLKRQKLGFYMNSSCDGCTRSSVLLNVWMTSRHHWRKRGQWRTLLFLAPLLCLTAASLCCSSQETMSPLSRPINHADEFTRRDQLACPTICHPSGLYLPLPPLRVPLVCFLYLS